jgi:hypothetical protein
MPRVLISATNAVPNPYFTVDRAVGRNAPNDRLDVLLVQVHLWAFTEYSSSPLPRRVPSGLRVATPLFRATTATPTHPKPQGSIVIDGICGDQTIGFIEYFQEQMRLAGFGVELNGQVAPYGTTGTTSMQLLNDKLSEEPRKMWRTSIYPQELMSSFYFF